MTRWMAFRWRDVNEEQRFVFGDDSAGHVGKQMKTRRLMDPSSEHECMCRIEVTELRRLAARGRREGSKAENHYRSNGDGSMADEAMSVLAEMYLSLRQCQSHEHGIPICCTDTSKSVEKPPQLTFPAIDVESDEYNERAAKSDHGSQPCARKGKGPVMIAEPPSSSKKR